MYGTVVSLPLVQMRCIAGVVVDIEGSFSMETVFESGVAETVKKQMSERGYVVSTAQHPPFNSLRTWQREERFSPQTHVQR